MDSSILTSPPPGHAHGPAWLIARRDEARALLAASPLPNRLDENWRFGELARADVSAFNYAPSPEPHKASWLERLPARPGGWLRIVFMNGRLVEAPAALPDGLAFLPFVNLDSSALERDFDADREQFGSGYFSLLHRAAATDGIWLATEAGAQIDAVVEIIHAVAGPGAAVFPATCVELAQGSRLQVLERHISLDDGEILSVGRQTLRLGPQASLQYALLQELNDAGRAVELGHAFVGPGASLEHLSSHTGAAWARQEQLVAMTGRESRAEILSANVVDGARRLDQRTRQEHRSPGAYSNLLFKNVLADSAKTVFSGMIRVEPGSHESDAYQSNRNLMLDDNAESNSLPGLEILADNVRCSHGSATSAIDPEETFYLRSRGIDDECARRMIAEGFLRQAVERFGSSAIAEVVAASFGRTAPR